MKLGRRNFLKSAAVLAAPGAIPAGLCQVCTDDAALLNVGVRKQLFLDVLLIESAQDIRRAFHQPRKYEGNPLIVKDKPWEHVVQFRSSGYTVLRDPTDKLFKAWYTDEGFTNEIVRRGITWPLIGAFMLTRKTEFTGLSRHLAFIRRTARTPIFT